MKMRFFALALDQSRASGVSPVISDVHWAALRNPTLTGLSQASLQSTCAIYMFWPIREYNAFANGPAHSRI